MKIIATALVALGVIALPATYAEARDYHHGSHHHGPVMVMHSSHHWHGHRDRYSSHRRWHGNHYTHHQSHN
jgi:hypothetical protein